MEPLLTNGSTAAVSVEVTVPAGKVATIVLTGTGYAAVEVEGLSDVFMKDYELQGSTRNRAARQLNGPCVFRIRRRAQGGECAVGYELTE